MKHSPGIAPRWLLAATLLIWGAEGYGSRIDRESCYPLYLLDENGSPVTGAEDLAVSPSGRSLIISAYDRRRVDPGAVETRGGIYRAELSDIIDTVHLRVETVVDMQVSGGPFRPHGFDIQSGPDGVHLAVINRGYSQNGHQQRHDSIQLFHVDERSGEAALVFTLPAEDRLCNPNDLTIAGKQLVFISNDHKACGGLGRWWEDLWGLPGSRVFVYRNGVYEAIGPDVAYANGVALLRDSADRITGLALSATRDRKVIILDIRQAAAQLASTASVTLDLLAAPDNITVTPEGDLYIAAHPDLLRYALYRAGWFGVRSAPSLVYRLHRDSSGAWQQDVIFEDNGDRISGATVAVYVQGYLVIGSAYDDHLLVCATGTTN